MYVEKYVRFSCFNLCLETNGLHYFVNRFVIFNKNFLVPWIIFIKENLILLICPFCYNIRLNNCLQLKVRSSILLVVLEILRNSAPINAPIEHFARDIRAVKWHPYNVEAKVISFVK